MRIPTRGLTAVTVLAAAGLLASAMVCPAASAQRERSLLGVRIWDSTWRSVLAKYGQPTRISVGASTSAAAGQAGGAGAGMMPGMPGMPGMAGGPMGMMRRGGGALPGLAGMGPGGPGMVGSGMGPGAPSMMGGGGGYAAAMQRMNRMQGAGGGMMGKGAMPGLGAPGGEGEMPGGFGPSGMPGMPGSLGAPGMMGGMGEGQQVAPEDEVTWVYERGPRTDFFLFNRDGRLIQVQSFGYANGAVTSHGVRLGDDAAKIYRDYGWPDNLEKDAGRGTMLLDYSHKHNVAFQLLDRHDGKGYRVVGITVGLTDKNQIPGNGGK